MGYYFCNSFIPFPRRKSVYGIMAHTHEFSIMVAIHFCVGLANNLKILVKQSHFLKRFREIGTTLLVSPLSLIKISPFAQPPAWGGRFQGLDLQSENTNSEPGSHNLREVIPTHPNTHCKSACIRSLCTQSRQAPPHHPMSLLTETSCERRVSYKN